MAVLAVRHFSLVYLAAGLAAWWRRPSNNIGAIIVLSGGVWLAAALVNTGVTALVAVGLILATFPLAVAVWLLHAFPSGRLRSTVSVATVVAAFVLTLGLQVPQYLFAPRSGDEALSIADRPDRLIFGLHLQRARRHCPLMLVTAVVLFTRLRQFSLQQRRVLGPLYAYGIVAVLVVPLGPLIPEPVFNLPFLGVTAGQVALLAGVPVLFVWSCSEAGSPALERLRSWGRGWEAPPRGGCPSSTHCGGPLVTRPSSSFTGRPSVGASLTRSASRSPCRCLANRSRHRRDHVGRPPDRRACVRPGDERGPRAGAVGLPRRGHRHRQ